MKFVVTDMHDNSNCPFKSGQNCSVTFTGSCDYDWMQNRCSGLIQIKDLQAISRERDTTKYNTMEIKEKKNYE